MNYRNRFPTLCVSLLLMVLVSAANAATVSYVLDQSNVLPDNIDYLTVTISDDTEGQLDFWVDIKSPLTDIAGSNFGIQAFSFNIAGTTHDVEYHHDRKGDEPPGLAVAAEHRAYGESEEHAPEVEHIRGDKGDRGEGRFCRLDSMLMADDFLLPEGWRVQLGKGGHHEAEDGFNVNLLGTGYSRQDPLHFTVFGLALEDVLAGFSVHVAGFEYVIGECGAGEGEGEFEGERGCEVVTSAWFYGERPAAVVPVPAAAWLFGSGLLGLAGLIRRRS